jgi:ribose transport system permease protein
LHEEGKNFLFKNSVLVMMLALIIVFSFTSPYFLSFNNIVNLLNQNSYFIIAAVGLGILMISGGMDLSVANQMALMGVIIAIMITEHNFPAIPAILIG